MECLYIDRDDQEVEEKRTEMTKEIIRLEEKILSECTDDYLRHVAIQTLCYVYPGNDCMHQLEEMKESVFDSIRQNKDVIGIENKLKVHAKYR